MEKLDRSKLDTRSLQVFLEVFETSSVSRAAEAFSVNQSSISYTLDRLRDYFADPLFVQLGRGITPTHRAAVLEPQIRRIVADIEGLTADTEFDPKKEDQPISIASNVTELLPELQKIRSAIWDCAPNIPVKFLELGSRDNIEPMLVQAKAEVVISVRLLRYPATLNHKTLLHDKPVVFYDPAVRKKVITIEDYGAARHAVLDFGGHKKSTVEAALEDRGFSRSIALSASNAHALASLMKGTDLIATMQARLQHSAFAGFLHCNPPVTLAPVLFDLVWHRRSDVSGRNSWLRNLIAETIADD
ncbi:MAG: LysR family transcriptional regulator [Pseudomonadota bacterium]